MARIPGPSLVEPYLKTERAKVHLDALKESLRSFRESDPITIFRRDNKRTGQYEIRLKVTDTPNEVPLILGDLLYCLRSALDQTIWQLARLRLPYPEGTQFPILSDKNNRETRKRFAQQTEGVPAVAKAIIKSLQPYNRADPTKHLLWRLNRLCNIDKHRRIPIHGDMVGLSFPEFPTKFGPIIQRDPAHHLISAPLALKRYMKVAPKGEFQVIFGDFSDGISCDLDGIIAIYDFVVGRVIPKFARFFQQAHKLR